MCLDWNITSRDEAEKLLESKDIDIEGRLSYEQFMGEETRAEKLFKLMDKDGDGWISKNVSQNLKQTELNNNILPSSSATSELDLILFYANFKKDLWISSSTFWQHFYFQEFKEVCKNLSKEQVKFL